MYTDNLYQIVFPFLYLKNKTNNKFFYNFSRLLSFDLRSDPFFRLISTMLFDSLYFNSKTESLIYKFSLKNYLFERIFFFKKVILNINLFKKITTFYLLFNFKKQYILKKNNSVLVGISFFILFLKNLQKKFEKQFILKKKLGKMFLNKSYNQLKNFTFSKRINTAVLCSKLIYGQLDLDFGIDCSENFYEEHLQVKKYDKWDFLCYSKKNKNLSFRFLIKIGLKYIIKKFFFSKYHKRKPDIKLPLILINLNSNITAKILILNRSEQILSNKLQQEFPDKKKFPGKILAVKKKKINLSKFKNRHFTKISKNLFSKFQIFKNSSNYISYQKKSLVHQSAVFSNLWVLKYVVENYFKFYSKKDHELFVNETLRKFFSDIIHLRNTSSNAIIINFVPIQFAKIKGFKLIVQN